MSKKRERTYSFDEYLETFFPNTIERGEIQSDLKFFVDKLADKSRQTLEHELRNEPREPSKA